MEILLSLPESHSFRQCLLCRSREAEFTAASCTPLCHGVFDAAVTAANAMGTYLELFACTCCPCSQLPTSSQRSLESQSVSAANHRKSYHRSYRIRNRFYQKNLLVVSERTNLPRHISYQTIVANNLEARLRRCRRNASASPFHRRQTSNARKPLIALRKTVVGQVQSWSPPAFLPLQLRWTERIRRRVNHHITVHSQLHSVVRSHRRLPRRADWRSHRPEKRNTGEPRSPPEVAMTGRMVLRGLGPFAAPRECGTEK